MGSRTGSWILIVVSVLIFTVFILFPSIYLYHQSDEKKPTVKKPDEIIVVKGHPELHDGLLKEKIKSHIDNLKNKASEKIVSLLYQLTTEVVVLPSVALETMQTSTESTVALSAVKTDTSTIMSKMANENTRAPKLKVLYK